MTDKLRTLMHERADAAQFKTPDVDALTRDGDRVRRKRTTAVVAGLCSAAVVGGGALFVVASGPGGSDDRVVAVDPDVAPAVPLDTNVVSWARGPVLHTPGSESDVGHPIKAYVRTAVGYVFTDGRGRVYALDKSGVQEVGTVTADSPRLVSDPRGDLAGWVDPSGDRGAFVILDQATGEISRDDSHMSTSAGGTEDLANLYAIEGTTVYRRDARGAVAIDTSSGDVQVIDADPVDEFEISGVGGGQVAFATEDGIAIGATRDGARPFVGVYGSPVSFSPDSRYLSAEGDESQVYDVATGAEVELDLDGGFATGVEWLDDGTLVVLAAQRPRDDAEAKLLNCSVPSGDCETVVASMGTFEDLEDDAALPGGETLG